mmetsp:Transcript_32568/g.72926  ORF Transcript_32568/g.72926 Transcript_32568/m.72926 type:complete len:207 (+) Transcript_32568:707-1327(+)
MLQGQRQRSGHHWGQLGLPRIDLQHLLARPNQGTAQLQDRDVWPVVFAGWKPALHGGHNHLDKIRDIPVLPLPHRSFARVAHGIRRLLIIQHRGTHLLHLLLEGFRNGLLDFLPGNLLRLLVPLLHHPEANLVDIQPGVPGDIGGLDLHLHGCDTGLLVRGPFVLGLLPGGGPALFFLHFHQFPPNVLQNLAPISASVIQHLSAQH